MENESEINPEMQHKIQLLLFIPYATLNKNVLRCFLKVGNVADIVWFQVYAAATEKDVELSAVRERH